MDYPINGSPSNMKFYSASPSKGAFVTVIGVSNDKVQLSQPNTMQTINN